MDLSLLDYRHHPQIPLDDPSRFPVEAGERSPKQSGETEARTIVMEDNGDSIGHGRGRDSGSAIG